MRAAPPWNVPTRSGSVLAMMMPSRFMRLIFCGSTLLISRTISRALGSESSMRSLRSVFLLHDVFDAARGKTFFKNFHGKS